MISFIHKYKIDWIALFLAFATLLLLIPNIANCFSGCSPESPDFYENQGIISSWGVISFLSLLFLACVLHVTPLLKKTISDHSLDNLIHLVGLVIFALILGINHLKFNFDGDDLTYQAAFSHQSFFTFLSSLYKNTTPCILIHLLVGVFVKLSILFWRLFDTLVMILCMELVIRIFVPKEKMRYSLLFLSFAILIPKECFCNAGWCATTLNYLWTGTASLVIYYFYKRVLSDRKISPFVFAISIPITLLACNSIQSAVLFFCITLATIGWSIYLTKEVKAVSHYLWFEFALSLLSLLFIALCPGNMVRSAGEVIQWFPNFNDYSTLQKLHMGFINYCTFFWSTGEWCVMKNHFPFVTLPLSIILSYRMLKEHKSPLLVISAIVIICFTIMPYLNFIISRYSALSCPLFDLFEQRFIYQEGLSLSAMLIPTLGYLFLTECLLIGIHDTFKGSWYGVLILLIFIAGICSSLILSFSPTLYASGERVMFFQSVAILSVTIAIYVKSLEEGTLSNKSFISICLFLAIFVPNLNSIKKTPTFANPFSMLDKLPFKEEEVRNYISIDLINGEEVHNQLILPNDTMVNINGWAYDGWRKRSLGDIFIDVNGHIIIGELNGIRTDVKKAFDVSDDTLGFNISIPAELFYNKKGERIDRISFGLVGKEHKSMFRPIHYTIQKPE